MKRAGGSPAELVPLIVADVFQLAGAFRAQGEAIAQLLGQTQARWQVLSAASAEPKTVAQIARRLGVTRQGVQRLANILVRDGSAVFRPNPDHRGSPHLVLTAHGKSDLARLGEAARESHRTIAEKLGGDELLALHQGLRRLMAVQGTTKMADGRRKTRGGKMR